MVQQFASNNKNVSIRYLGVPMPKLPGRLSEISKNAMLAGLRFWREAYAPKHFRSSAAQVYGNGSLYKKRISETARAEKRARYIAARTGRQVDASHFKISPLVKTGRLKNKVLNGPVTLRATGKTSGSLKARMQFKGLPRYVYYRPGGHNLTEEITVTTQAEAKAMAGVIDRETQRGVAASNLS